MKVVSRYPFTTQRYTISVKVRTPSLILFFSSLEPQFLLLRHHEPPPFNVPRCAIMINTPMRLAAQGRSMLRPYRNPRHPYATLSTPSSWKSTLSFSNHAKPYTAETPPSAQLCFGIGGARRPLYDWGGSLARDAAAMGAMGSFSTSPENLGHWCAPRAMLFSWPCVQFVSSLCPLSDSA